ncbi:hypothetical protein MTR_5g025820 [Medicago truncatula]|uniref:Uncharacterized protein n=1 Tax=Medicago truncatula TaxID=3880 RepID=G7K435_MEDTR|nr:hypothetical protein MTR_5g025820 [Medicago truncatula]
MSMLGLFFLSDSNLQILCFYDDDWVGFLDFRRSFSGQCFFLDKSLVSWPRRSNSLFPDPSQKLNTRY